MSKQALFEQDDGWFLNEAKILTFEIVDGDGNPLDVSSFGLAYILEKLHDGVDDILSVVSPTITVSDGAGEGSKVSIPIAASATATLEPLVYRQSLGRTDGGEPQLLARGSAMLQRGAQWDDGS